MLQRIGMKILHHANNYTVAHAIVSNIVFHFFADGICIAKRFHQCFINNNSVIFIRRHVLRKISSLQQMHIHCFKKIFICIQLICQLRSVVHVAVSFENKTIFIEVVISNGIARNCNALYQGILQQCIF